MIEQLFGSKTRVKLLHLFFSNPNRSFYVREITRKIDEQINSVRRELANLLSIGLISSENTDNKLYYEVDQNYQHYAPLRQIFTHITDSEHVDDSDNSKRFREIGSVKKVFLLGFFVRDDSALVDLFIVGDVNQVKLDKLVKELEKEEGKEVRYTVLDPDDYEYRKKIGDRFVTQILESKKSIIIDVKKSSPKKTKQVKQEKK
ncbi:TPA: transcriptional regulator [Candidatus Saccharibacteria bacterium]|nr:transcriptional regulator [Candidatus Saccharibacteria bacterium]HIO87692.1 transcriptional regulator [Candidatus Saccharibacteria bacterium]